MPEARTITVLLFGPLAQAVGCDRVRLGVPRTAVDVAEVRRRLAEEAPTLAPWLASCRLAVNHDFADEDQTVSPEDEVALIGMVSGG
jgi:molybdopterin converting factor small subunit